MKNTKAVGFAIAAAIMLSLLSMSFARPTTTKAETAGLAETRQPAVQSMNNADFAQQNVDLADRSFLDYILSDANFAGNVEYSRSPLYDAELQTSGRQYAFTIGNASGYALLAEIKGENKTFFEVEELFYDKPSPFSESSGFPVYVTHGVYLDYRSGTFYDLKSGDLVGKTLVAEFSERGFGYRGLREFESRYQTVGYASKDVSSYSIQYDLPSYYGTPDSTTCATIAGTIVLGYYDRFYEELIPNYQVYTRLGTRVKYKALSQNILDLSSELYDLMGGEREHLGTTYSEFQDGMNTYIKGKGRSYSTMSVLSSGKFDFEKYKTSVENNKPVVLFLSSFAIRDYITQEGTTDTIKSDFSTTPHVVVGCGYEVHKYFNSAGQVTDTRIYLKVSTGLTDYLLNYLNINGGLSEIDRAISVEIS